MGSETSAGQVISETAKAENFQQAAQEVGAKMVANPADVTSDDAAYLKSREARATGQPQAPADSLSAEAERLASVNEGDANIPNQSDLTPEQQSRSDRLENFEQAAGEVASKMATKPEYVTEEDAARVHSREHHAFGETSKGGIASQAQSLALENEKRGTV